MKSRSNRGFLNKAKGSGIKRKEHVRKREIRLNKATPTTKIKPSQQQIELAVRLHVIAKIMGKAKENLTIAQIRNEKDAQFLKQLIKTYHQLRIFTTHKPRKK